MAENIKCTITAERKYRGGAEYHFVPTVTCEEFGVQVQGHGMLYKNVAREIADKGADPERGLELRWDHGTLSMTVVPLKTWLKRTDNRPEQLKKNSGEQK